MIIKYFVSGQERTDAGARAMAPGGPKLPKWARLRTACRAFWTGPLRVFDKCSPPRPSQWASCDWRRLWRRTVSDVQIRSCPAWNQPTCGRKWGRWISISHVPRVSASAPSTPSPSPHRALHLKESRLLTAPSLPCPFPTLALTASPGSPVCFVQFPENWTMHPFRNITASRPSAPSRGT